VIFLGKKKREEEIFEKRCLLRECKKNIFNSSGPLEEKMIEVQEVDREIAFLDFELHELQKKKKNGAYCLAKIKIVKDKKEPKEIKVIIKDYGVLPSLQTNEYIISKDCLLACAIMRTPVNGVAEYRVGNSETALLVREKRIL